MSDETEGSDVDSFPGLIDASSDELPSSTEGSDSSNLCGVILHAMEVTLGQQSTKWHETFLAAGSDRKLGLVMLDSGCFRCIAGKRTHEDDRVSEAIWTQALADKQSRRVYF